MQISNIRKNKKDESGYTLIELIIVIAGIAALGSFSIPPILNSIKLNKIEEAKAIMNGYVAECLGELRIKSQEEFIKDSVPEADEDKLNTLGYTIDPNKTQCFGFGIKPIKENEKDLYAFEFQVLTSGKVIKKGTPSDNREFKPSCKSWAGKGCGATPEQEAKWRLEAETEEKKLECQQKWNQHVADKGSGEILTWDDDAEPPDKCVKNQWTYDGKKVNPNSFEGYLAAKKSGEDEECSAWISEVAAQKDGAYINGEGIQNALCKDEFGKTRTVRFHTGDFYYNQDAWDEKHSKYKARKCQDDLALVLEDTGDEGDQYTPSPEGYTSPVPCGRAHWLCPLDGDSGTIYDNYQAYEAESVCKNIPEEEEEKEEEEDKKPVPDRCKNFKPDRRCGSTYKRNHPRCRCI